MVAVSIHNFENSLGTGFRTFGASVLPSLPFLIISTRQIGDDVSGAERKDLCGVLPVSVIIRLASCEHVQGCLAHPVVRPCDTVEWVRRVVSQSNAAKTRADIDNARVVGLFEKMCDFVG